MEALLVLLIYVAIVCLIGWVLITLLPMTGPVRIAIEVVIALICLLFLLRFVGALPHHVYLG